MIAVMALVPKTANAAKVLRSAWIPAPPLESEPAMVSATAVMVARKPTTKATRAAPLIAERTRAVSTRQPANRNREFSNLSNAERITVRDAG